MSTRVSRRAFVAAAAASGAALGLRGFVDRAEAAEEPRSPDGAPSHEIKLGVASYSLRKFPRAQAIAMTKALRTPYINLKSMHMPYELSAADIAVARGEIESAGLQIVGGGTITFDKDTDEDVRKYFEYAKAAGMPTMVSTANPAFLPRIEKFAKQYDIKVAIHNHGPEDKNYPAPRDVMKYVKNMDRRMGLCIDVGHTVRTGADVVREIADAGPRLHDMHVKDLRDLKARDSQCIIGEGAIPFPAIFRQLRAMKYQGFVNMEYEIDENDPLPGMQRSLAYMRGVLAGMGVA
jgi:sugar phosphate isomerase/epimerase